MSMCSINTEACRQRKTERSKTERDSDGSGLSILAGAHTVYLLEMEDSGSGTSLLLCPGKMIRQGN